MTSTNPNTSLVHLELLDHSRQEIFSALGNFRNLGVLAGGTALMLQISHRRSFDFDIFLSQPVPPTLLRTVNQIFSGAKVIPLLDTTDQLMISVNGANLTFLYYPFPQLHPNVPTNVIDLYSIADIASSKAYVIGRRPAWRDYVDMFFLLRDHLDLTTIITEATERFPGNFSEKLFLEQLTYFEDLQEFTFETINEPVSVHQIQNFLNQQAKNYVAYRI